MKRLSKSNYDDDVERELRNINDKKSRGRDSDKENRSDERTRKDTRGKYYDTFVFLWMER